MLPRGPLGCCIRQTSHVVGLSPQTYVQFQTAVVLNQNLKPIFFNQPSIFSNPLSFFPVLCCVYDLLCKLSCCWILGHCYAPMFLVYLVVGAL